MSAKNFMITSFFSLVVILLVYAIVVDKMVILERNIPYSYKQFALQSLSEIQGKVIISAGSNAIHGIDSAKLSQYFNSPVFTYADNADYPLRAKILSIEKHTNKGDVVLLPLEWLHYSAKQGLAENYVDALADEELRLEFYFNNLPALEKLKFIFTQYPLSDVISGLKIQRNKIAMLKSDLKQLNYFTRVVQSGEIQMLGNSLRNGPEQIVKFPTNKTCDSYLFSGGFKVSRVFKDNLSLLKKLTRKGVAIYFTWPAVVDYKKSNCYQQNTINNVNKYATEIKELVENKGYQFIGNYQQSHFPAHCFLNTYYHIKRECAILRTNKLIEALKFSNIKKIHNTSDINIALMMNNEIIRNKNYIFYELIKALPELKKGKITAEQLSHRLVFKQGWAEQEKWGIWTVGNESAFSFSVAKSLLTRKYIMLSIKGHYFNGVEKTKVKINSVYYGEEELANKSFKVSVNSVSDNRIDITLQHTSAFSPKYLGLSKDTRKIKFGLTEISINATDDGTEENNEN